MTTSSTQSSFNFDSTVPAPPDQADTALRILDDSSDGDYKVADEGVARLLAATMHDGPGTALEAFASSGDLDAERALTELNEVTVPLEREAWVDALGHYILTTGGRS
jgi:hypothetical protein